MSLADFIEKLQKKPRYVKVQIMWVVVTVCMVIIFAAWVWSLTNIGTKATASQSQETADTLGQLGQIKQDIPSLWQSLGAGISNVFESAKEQLNNVTSSESTTPSATPVEAPAQTLPTE